MHRRQGHLIGILALVGPHAGNGQVDAAVARRRNAYLVGLAIIEDRISAGGHSHVGRGRIMRDTHAFRIMRAGSQRQSDKWDKSEAIHGAALTLPDLAAQHKDAIRWP